MQLLRKPDLAQQQHKSQESLMESGEETGVYRARTVEVPTGHAS